MSVLTEYDVRKLFIDGKIQANSKFVLEEDQILTPAALSFLNEKNIGVREKGEKGQPPKEQAQVAAGTASEPEGHQAVYETLFGVTLTEKPEHMTSLRGDLLVFKDHPVIAFRGAIDSLESCIILLQLKAQKERCSKLTADLEEIVGFIHNLIRVEITGEPVGAFSLQGLSEKELREHSHHPGKYYGISHFLPGYKQGEMVGELNFLRTKTREVELTAYRAFRDEYGKVRRGDIIQALNRLSSLFWIMMVKYLKGLYKD